MDGRAGGGVVETQRSIRVRKATRGGEVRWRPPRAGTATSPSRAREAGWGGACGGETPGHMGARRAALRRISSNALRMSRWRGDGDWRRRIGRGSLMARRGPLVDWWSEKVSWIVKHFWRQLLRTSGTCKNGSSTGLIKYIENIKFIIKM